MQMYNQLYRCLFVMDSYKSYHKRTNYIVDISEKKRLTNGIDLLVEKTQILLKICIHFNS